MKTPAHGCSFGAFRALRKLRCAPEKGEQASSLSRTAGTLPAATNPGWKPGLRNSQDGCSPFRLKRGMVLVESMLALSILTLVGLLLLKLSLNILHPRQWMLQQSVTDAYMTFERSFAERIPFENLLAADSPWPHFPATSTTTVEIGRLPGNRIVTGNVTRTRMPDAGNFPMDGGSGTVATNPAAMKIWKAQSVLTYKIGGRTYAKSRTVLRSQ